MPLLFKYPWHCLAKYPGFSQHAPEMGHCPSVTNEFGILALVLWKEMQGYPTFWRLWATLEEELSWATH